ncbi:MAG: prepilin-type N-terminal cleavage/methylation domain-containing protein [Verrucomicrobiia bacterium]
MTPLGPFSVTPRRGFTVIELLVSFAVFVIILGALVAISSTVFNIWRHGSSRADNFTKARVALDVICLDLREGLLNQEWPAFTDSSGFPAITFLTRRRTVGTSSPRPLSAVSYQVKTDGTLSDIDFGLARGTAPFGFTTDPPSQTAPGISQTGMNFQTIGPGVIALNLHLMDQNGNFTQISEWPTDPNRFVAVVVSLAVVHERTLALLRENGQIDTLLSRLAAASGGGTPDPGAWNTKVESGDLFDGLIGPTRQDLWVFQRTVPLQRMIQP